MEYAALIMDVIDSRLMSTEDRIVLSVTLALNGLNRVFIPNLPLKVETSMGDELQGLFFTPMDAFLYYRWVQLYLYPVRIRAGVGIGPVLIPDARSTHEQDGPAYHNARRALSDAQEPGNNAFIIYGPDKQINELINVELARTIDSFRLQNSLQQQYRAIFESIAPISAYGTYDISAMFQIILDIKSLIIKRHFPPDSVIENNKEYPILDMDYDFFYPQYRRTISESVKVLPAQDRNAHDIVKRVVSLLSSKLSIHENDLFSILNDFQVLEERANAEWILRLLDKYYPTSVKHKEFSEDIERRNNLWRLV